MQLVPQRGVGKDFAERHAKKVGPPTWCKPEARLHNRRTRNRGRVADYRRSGSDGRDGGCAATGDRATYEEQRPRGLEHLLSGFWLDQAEDLGGDVAQEFADFRLGIVRAGAEEDQTNARRGFTGDADRLRDLRNFNGRVSASAHPEYGDDGLFRGAPSASRPWLERRDIGSDRDRHGMLSVRKPEGYLQRHREDGEIRKPICHTHDDYLRGPSDPAHDRWTAMWQ